ncbi:MAG: PQQ-dependent sugar dehydrogenase [Patescibacteria group bacterium]
MKNSFFKRLGLFGIIFASILVGNVFYLLQTFNYRTIPITPINQKDYVEVTTKVIAEGLRVPWSVGFTSENRLIVTERPGRVRQIVDNVMQEKPLHTFDEVKSESEEGLMGVAVDPEYTKNKYLYFMYAYSKDDGLKIKVVRMLDYGDRLENNIVLIDNIECTQNHAGGRIAFGPDKKLYITTGDALNTKLPQDLNSPNGKLLRLNNDGSIPEDNPFPNSPIWSYGHRNSQGIAWDNNGRLLSTEHGPSFIDGPTGGDEINEITKGGNYGWPEVSHGRKSQGTINELFLMTPAIAPSGIVFYIGNQFPQLNNSYIFTGLAGQGLYQIKNNNNYQKIPGLNSGRIRDIVQSPEGKLYILTSNTDYRGTPQPGDDKILLLTSKN